MSITSCLIKVLDSERIRQLFPVMENDSGESHEMPIDGILDLHTFRPDDVKELIPDYIGICLENGVYQLRIIHGKGKGVLRRIVHAALENHPAVVSFRHETGSGGSWGATVVDLKKPANK